jgi:DNA helicase-2/ATP-dependent DNA helicase PcrA
MDQRDKQIFDGLNDAQKAVVTTTTGPVLVIAGPGTGKTHTMVRRIAYMVHRGVPPERICAVTFTNRAACEMKERAEALLGNCASNLFIGTFHLLGLRIIQDNWPYDFSICSRDEQIELLKSLISCSARYARQAADIISMIKNKLEPEILPSASLSKGREGGVDADERKFYDDYQALLRKLKFFDFDDLILKATEILADSKTVQFYRDKYSFIIVDEYQDINPLQYRFLRRITNSENNICVVGDADQAIYGFRGADIGNFLNFEKDFPEAARITLCKNYRSTGVILQASDALIKNNEKRIDKNLTATREQGAHIVIADTPDEGAEGDFIIRKIEMYMGGTSHFYMRQNDALSDYGETSCRFSDFAVVYRTNAQAEALEETFSKAGIPYQVLGRRSGMRIREMEETIAYLQSIIRAGKVGVTPENPAWAAKLLSPADFYDPRSDAVTLLTMHMAKGLEFQIVFIAGAEEGITPYTFTKEEVDAEEERRLFYVGMTRAKSELFLIHTRNRFLYGQRTNRNPSSYLRAIPEGLVDKIVIPERKTKLEEKNRQLGLF